MPASPPPGQIVILNGAPRSGKSSIVAALQTRDNGRWVNLGVDLMARATPPALRPGIGLRPGGERPDLESAVAALYATLYAAVAACSRSGLDVAVDVGHHDDHSRPLPILADAAEQLRGLPVLFVGVRCPVEVVMARRDAAPDGYETSSRDAAVPPAVARWQHAVHRDRTYDLEVDTSTTTPADCAELIATRLATGPPGTAFAELRSEPQNR